MVLIKINIGTNDGVDNSPRKFSYDSGTGILKIWISKYMRKSRSFKNKLLPIIKKFPIGTKLKYKSQNFNNLIFDKR